MPLEIIRSLKIFRDKIYQFFPSRKDAAMELVDSLSSNIDAVSIVALSLNSMHRRNYCSITRVLDEFKQPIGAENEAQNKKLTQLLSSNCLSKQKRSFNLFVVDCTPNPRKFSPTLKDKSYIYSPNAVPGLKPVTIGHKYSIVAYLPEKNTEDTPPWIVPLSSTRVCTDQTGSVIGMQQITSCIKSQLSFSEELNVSVGDCEYSSPLCLGEAKKYNNQVHITRARNHRNFYHPIINEPNRHNKRGRLKRYGDVHKLHESSTWKDPDQTTEFTIISKKKKFRIVKIKCWDSIIMRGKKECKLSDYPFRLLQVQVYKESGELLYTRPLWLIAAGSRRLDLSLSDVFNSYCQRFDIEHFFKFGKTRLLLDKFQTPDTNHEESWWKLAMISYAQLYLARNIAYNKPNPWEKWLPSFSSVCSEKQPVQVQKDFERIIREIGTPAKPPKPRKKSLGRQLGQSQIKRAHFPVIVKSSRNKKTENTAKMKA